MKILVTGAAGYLGSVMVPELLKIGHEVIAIDNFMYGQNSLLECCYNDNFTMVKGDVRDRELIKSSLKGVDVIIPLACYTGAPLCAKDPIGATTVSLDAVKMILELRDKEQKVIYPTTNSGYGIGQEGIFCTEETPLNPISLYGKIKCEAERAVLDAGNSITLRLATVFGASPRMRLDLLVNDFTHRAVNDRFLVLFESKFKRNYVHVRDVANAFIHCINNFEQMKGETYNVGLSEANLNKWELCEEIKKQLPDFYFVEAEIGEDPDKRNYVVSNEKIEKTGFKAKVTIEEGIKELIKAYKILHKAEYYNA